MAHVCASVVHGRMADNICLQRTDHLRKCQVIYFADLLAEWLTQSVHTPDVQAGLWVTQAACHKLQSRHAAPTKSEGCEQQNTQSAGQRAVPAS